jgi:hypothetical protein
LYPSFRGLSVAKEPGIHDHRREYGFRARRQRRPGMTLIGYEASVPQHQWRARVKAP